MRLFNQVIIDELNARCNSCEVSFLGLGKFDFQIGMDHLHIQAEKKVRFVIDDRETVWTHGPCSAEVWRLIGARPTRFELNGEDRLVMRLDNGCVIEFLTDEGPYECVSIQLGGFEHEFF